MKPSELAQCIESALDNVGARVTPDLGIFIAVVGVDETLDLLYELKLDVRRHPVDGLIILTNQPIPLLKHKLLAVVGYLTEIGNG